MKLVSPDIEEARRKFASSLVGRWSSAPGTFGMVMCQVWVIRPDGTGQFTDSGPFGYPRSETRFEWRQTNDFVFEMRLTEYVELHADYAHDLDEEDREWRKIHYDFTETPVDFWTTVGLIDKAQVGEQRGFLNSFAPLVYSRPIEPELQDSHKQAHKLVVEFAGMEGREKRKRVLHAVGVLILLAGALLWLAKVAGFFATFPYCGAILVLTGCAVYLSDDRGR